MDYVGNNLLDSNSWMFTTIVPAGSYLTLASLSVKQSWPGHNAL